MMAGMNTVPDPETERRRIQRSRSIVMALLLAGFVVLVFAISIVKIA